MGRPCRGRIDHRVSWQGLNLRPIPNVLSETGQVWIETVTRSTSLLNSSPMRTV